MNPVVIAALDNGIRDLVVYLNLRGFHTTDSGDGTKAGGLAERHVFMTVDPPRDLLDECHRLADELTVIGERVAAFGTPGWNIQGTYDPVTRVAVLMLMEHQ